MSPNIASIIFIVVFLLLSFFFFLRFYLLSASISVNGKFSQYLGFIFYLSGPYRFLKLITALKYFIHPPGLPTPSSYHCFLRFLSYDYKPYIYSVVAITSILYFPIFHFKELNVSRYWWKPKFFSTLKEIDLGMFTDTMQFSRTCMYPVYWSLRTIMWQNRKTYVSILLIYIIMASGYRHVLRSFAAMHTHIPPIIQNCMWSRRE